MLRGNNICETFNITSQKVAGSLKRLWVSSFSTDRVIEIAVFCLFVWPPIVVRSNIPVVEFSLETVCPVRAIKIAASIRVVLSSR